MNEHPMLFSAPMVRAILSGAKTQTRRIMKPQPDDDGVVTVGDIGDTRGIAYVGNKRSGGIVTRVPCPYWPRLWVRETGWERPERTPKMMCEGADTWERYYYDADGLTDGDHEQFKEWGFKRRPSIFMPRWASRITLDVIGVRVERLKEISEANAGAEGVIFKSGDFESNRAAFAVLWDHINAKRAPWASNPFVWVIEFNRITQ